MSTRAYVNPDVIEVAKNIVADYKDELTSIRIGKDPRTLENPTWISVEEAIIIYNHIISEIGVDMIGVDYTSLNYAITHPTTNIVGVPKKGQFSRICECVWMLNSYIRNRSVIPFSATIFFTLCELNEYTVSFEVGEVYDIFIDLYDNKFTTLKDFEQEMLSHLVSKFPKDITPV